MVLIGIGSNLGSAQYGTPLATVTAALEALAGMRVCVAARSGWYRSEPVPPSDQPWYVNGVAALATELGPMALLETLLAVETRFGRVRGARNSARVLDLDLLDYEGWVIDTPSLILPHPRLHRRRFVLRPLAEIAPGWCHPLLGCSANQLLMQLPRGEQVCRIEN